MLRDGKNANKLDYTLNYIRNYQSAFSGITNRSLWNSSTTTSNSDWLL